MDNPEKLATQGTQDEDKQNKNTTQYALGTTITNKHIRHELSCKQLEVKTNQTSFFEYVFLSDLDTMYLDLHLSFKIFI
jgi:hypothetical protein